MVSRHAPGSPVPSADALDGVRQQTVIAQQHGLDIEQRPYGVRQRLGHPLAGAAQLLLGRSDRGHEGTLLDDTVVARAIGYRLEPGLRLDQHRLADGQSVGRRHTLDERVGMRVPAQQFAHRIKSLGIVNGLGQLRRQTEKERHLIAGVRVIRRLPCHQYAQELAVVNQRRAEKAAIRLLGRIGRCPVAWAGLGIRLDEQLPPLSHEAHETFPRSDADPSGRLGTKPVGGDPNVLIVFLVGQIDRTGVNLHGLSHLLDGDVQDFAQSGRDAHLLHDLPQCDKHGVNVLTRPERAL